MRYCTHLGMSGLLRCGTLMSNQGLDGLFVSESVWMACKELIFTSEEALHELNLQGSANYESPLWYLFEDV